MRLLSVGILFTALLAGCAEDFNPVPYMTTDTDTDSSTNDGTLEQGEACVGT